MSTNAIFLGAYLKRLHRKSPDNWMESVRSHHIHMAENRKVATLKFPVAVVSNCRWRIIGRHQEI